jgi:hypothetical protein
MSIVPRSSVKAWLSVAMFMNIAIDARAQSTAWQLAFAFSEGAGIITVDQHAGTTGTLTGDVTWEPAGRLGTALRFNGGNTGVDITVPDSGTFSAAFTISAWVAPEGTGWQSIVTGQSADNSPQFGVYVGADYRPYVEVQLGKHLRSLRGVTTLPRGSWSHIAATYDGQMLRLLVNGVVDVVEAMTGTMPSTTLSLQIGRDSGANFFAGRIDEVRIDNIASSVADVVAAMDTPVDPATPLLVMRTSPVDQALGVLTTPVTATFSRPLDPASVTADVVTLHDAALSLMATTVSYDATTRTVTIAAEGPLARLTTYTATLHGGGSGVRDTDGAVLADDVTWSFRTAAPGALVGAWPFSEGAGDTTSDYTGNGNAGTLSGVVNWEAAGRMGTALRFDGNSGGVHLAVTDSLALSSAFTIAAWISPHGTGWQSVVSRQMADNSPQLGLYVGADYRPYVEVQLESGLQSLWGLTALPRGNFSHVAATYDGQMLRLLVNGVVDAEIPVSGTLPPTARRMQIGRDSHANFFRGAIDELRIYNIALSAADTTAVLSTPIDPATPLLVVLTSPPPGTLGVVSTPITATFSTALDPTIITRHVVTLSDSRKARLSVTVGYDALSRTLLVTPQKSLEPLTTYTATLRAGTDGVHDIEGGTLAAEVQWSFRTAASGALVAAWAFNEGSGSTTADQTGNGNTGTLSGDVSWDSAGQIGTALRFEGSGGVDIAVTDSGTLSGAFTISAWVAPEGTGWQSIITRQAADNSPQVGLYVSADYRPYVEVQLDGRLRPLLGAASLIRGSWSHIAAIYDGQTLRLFVNGVLDAAEAMTGTLPSTMRPLQIGRDSAANFFRGRLDEVSIYNIALTDCRTQRRCKGVNMRRTPNIHR